MIVYIVVHGENHEGSCIVGTYSTLEKAEKKAKKERRGISSCEYVSVIEWELDGKEVVKSSLPMTAEQKAKWIELNRPFFESVTQQLKIFAANVETPN